MSKIKQGDEDLAYWVKTSNKAIFKKIAELTKAILEKYIIKTPDSIIAATAKALQLPLVTSDKDLKKISDISIIFI